MVTNNSLCLEVEIFISGRGLYKLSKKKKMMQKQPTLLTIDLLNEHREFLALFLPNRRFSVCICGVCRRILTTDYFLTHYPIVFKFVYYVYLNIPMMKNLTIRGGQESGKGCFYVSIRKGVGSSLASATNF